MRSYGLVKKRVVLAASCVLTQTAWAQAEAVKVQETQLAETVVQAKSLEEAGQTTYNKRKITATPGGNGDITSILIRNPSVAFDNANLSSDTPGDLDPAKISVNGAKHYDNLFLVDGLNAGSSISGGVTTEANAINESYMPKADNSLAISVDTKLLCNITVHDSGVGAEHGRFLGGVVDAEVCAPKKKFGGDVSLEYSTSKWTEDKKAPGANALSTSASKQHTFTKWTQRYNFQAKVSDSLGLVGSYTSKNSKMPLQGYSKGNDTLSDTARKNARQEVENFMLKGFFAAGAGIDGDFTILNTPSFSTRFTENAKDSNYTNEAGGAVYALGLNHELAGAKISHKLSYKQTNSSRDGDANVKKTWRYSEGDKDWGTVGTNYNSAASMEGGPGDINQRESVVSYKLKSAFDGFNALGAAHQITAGLELERNEFVYERPNDYLFYSALKPTSSCTQADGSTDSETCSLAPIKWNAPAPWSGSNQGQYFYIRSKYRAGSINYDSNYYALYAEDAMRWGAWSLRAGLRWESFSDAVKHSISPRLNAAYDFGPTMGSKLSLGANRYYGQNLKVYQIWSRALTLSSGTEQRTIKNGVLQPWAQAADKPMETPEALKVPYADELMVAWEQKWGNTNWRLKYVHRASENEVTRRKNSNLWENKGSSQTDIVTMAFDTLKPIDALGAWTHFSAALDYSKKKSTHTDWSEYLFSEDDEVEQVYYRGNVVDKFEMPPQNFHRPWTLRFMSSTDFKKIGLHLDTIVRVRQGFTKAASVGGKIQVNGVNVQPYQDIRMPRTVNVDMRIAKDWKMSRYSKIYAELAVENIFNRSNVYGFDGYQYQLEKGRQATVRMGYEF